MKTKHKNNTKSHALLFISHYELVRYESNCGHKIEEVTPKQTGDDLGRRQTKQNKQTGKRADRRKRA